MKAHSPLVSDNRVYPDMCHRQSQAPRISLRPTCLKNPINSPGCLLERGSASHPPFIIALGGLTTLVFSLGKWQIQDQFMQLTELSPVRGKRRQRE